LTLRETYALNRLSSFKNLRRKGGKFDHRPGRPKVLLRHCFHPVDPKKSLSAFRQRLKTHLFSKSCRLDFT